MAKIELQEKTSYQKNDFEPVVLSDGTTVTMGSIVDGEKKTMNGKAEKDGKEVAMFRLNPDGNRLFMQVQPLDGVTNAVAVEIIETFLEGVKYLFKD